MAAAWYRARAELRRRWKATLGLTLLVGLVGAVVLTGVAGARRSASAYDRFRQSSRSADLLLTTEPDLARLEQLRRLPQVEAVAPIALFFMRPEGSDANPGNEFVTLTGRDGAFLDSVDRVRAVQGRKPNPEQPGEIAVSESFADMFDLAVGREVTFESITPERAKAVERGEQPPEPDGPRVTARVVGILRSPLDLSDDLPTAYFTQGFYRAYAGRIEAFEGLSRVRLRGGEAGLEAFTNAARQIYADQPDMSISPADEEVGRVADAISVLVTGLALFALVAGLAGMVAVAQALMRHQARSAEDQPVLASVGMAAPGRIAAASLSLGPAVVGGTLLAAAASVLASPLMPIGLARQAEPEPGFSLDVLVLGLGGIAVAAISTAMVMAVSWRATRVATGAGGSVASGGPRPSAAVRAMVRAGFPPPATTGARMAFEPGRGQRAVPVRSGLVGSAVGVAGLVGAVVFAASLTALVDTPSRYGWGWDLNMSGPEAGGDQLVERFGADLVSDPAVADLASVRKSQLEIGGVVVAGYGFQSLKGSLAPPVSDGHAAHSPDEVVLGNETLQRLGRKVGDDIEVGGPGGPVRLRVVGRGPIPSIDTDTVGEGALMTRQGLDRLAPGDVYTDLVLNWADGVDRQAAVQRLEERFGPVITDNPPADVTNLKRVEALPRVLAVFLALLAVLAVGHTLLTAGRRRRTDLAVLKALGFERGQVRATVAWQASLLAVVGLVLGVPLGVAAGRWAWSFVADGVGVINRSEVPFVTLTIMVPAAVLVANLIAALPARLAANTQPALVLRAE